MLRNVASYSQKSCTSSIRSVILYVLLFYELFKTSCFKNVLLVCLLVFNENIVCSMLIAVFASVL